jgi:hypothetical protein
MNIRFYDNEEANWEYDMSVFKDQIEFIHVNYYEPNILISSIEAPPLDNSSSETVSEKNRIVSERNRILISAYIDYWVRQNNTYALYLKEMIKDPIASNEILKQDIWGGSLSIQYPNNGLNIDDLLVWSSSGSNKLVLSDWDRTITVVEGIYFGQTEETSLTSKVEKGLVMVHDLLVYLMGGEERLEKVKNMFSELNKNGVPIFILTHNRNASKMFPKNRELSLKMLKEIMPTKSIEYIDSILFSSLDYISMDSIKESDGLNSYKKYKSTCSIDIIKDVLKECSKYIITGGKRKMYGKRKNKMVTRRKRNKRLTKNRNKKTTRKYK